MGVSWRSWEEGECGTGPGNPGGVGQMRLIYGVWWAEGAGEPEKGGMRGKEKRLE